VLAAYSRGDTDATDGLVAVVGNELELVRDLTDNADDVPTLGTIDVSQLVEEKTPAVPDLFFGSVFDKPLAYILKRDAASGEVQNLEAGTAIVPATVTAGAGRVITIVLPSDIEIPGRPGWIRLRDSSGQIFDTDVTVKPISNADLSKCTATVVAPANTYTMVLLVKGFPGLIKDGINIT
jgi:hypothetical protein